MSFKNYKKYKIGCVQFNRLCDINSKAKTDEVALEYMTSGRAKVFYTKADAREYMKKYKSQPWYSWLSVEESKNQWA